MEQRIDYMVLLFLLICLSTTTSEGRKYFKHSKRLVQQHSTVNHLVAFETSDSDPNNNLGSPNYLPPYGDVMGPTSSPNMQNPPYCLLPPLTPMTPPTTLPTPILPIQSSPPPPFISISPPTPPLFEPSPPEFGPSPPTYVPGPPEFAPGPPIFMPPVVYPPPTAPPPPPPHSTGTGPGLWCVVKPTVPDPIIQEAMNYACGSGADCEAIQPNGKCYQPDTLIAHASFAFNSYWQRTKVAGGNCDFGGTAMLITKDPSYDGCHFDLS